MAIDYTALAATATKLVTDAGREITFVRLAKAAATNTTPWRGAAPDPRTPADATTGAQAVAVEPSSAVALGIATADSDFIKRAEAIYIVEPAPDLETYDEVIVDSVRFQINEVQKLKPATTTLLYFVSVRR